MHISKLYDNSHPRSISRKTFPGNHFFLASIVEIALVTGVTDGYGKGNQKVLG